MQTGDLRVPRTTKEQKGQQKTKKDNKRTKRTTTEQKGQGSQINAGIKERQITKHRDNFRLGEC